MPLRRLVPLPRCGPREPPRINALCLAVNPPAGGVCGTAVVVAATSSTAPEPALPALTVISATSSLKPNNRLRAGTLETNGTPSLLTVFAIAGAFAAAIDALPSETSNVAAVCIANSKSSLIGRPVISANDLGLVNPSNIVCRGFTATGSGDNGCFLIGVKVPP